MSNDLLNAARVYARAGWPVFPCEPGTKHPFAGSHGFKDASTDLETVGRWWTSAPDANIATPTGVVVDVLDVDVRKEGDGYRALHRLARAGLLKGAVAEAETRNAGRHYYYPVSGSSCRAFRGHFLDVKAAGGYVLLPPSKVPADEGMEGPGCYRWLNFDHTAGHPLDVDAIAARLNPPPPRTPAPPRQSGSLDDLVGWVGQLSEGNRNAGLFWAACRAVESGATDLDALVAAAVSTGLTEVEARRTVASATRAVAA